MKYPFRIQTVVLFIFVLHLNNCLPLSKVNCDIHALFEITCLRTIYMLMQTRIYCSYADFYFTCAYSATTLTSWHLLVTFCSLHVALWMKFFEHKPFDSRAVMGFGILNGISIGLLNLCLGFNSVGFYQVKFCFLLEKFYNLSTSGKRSSFYTFVREPVQYSDS